MSQAMSLSDCLFYTFAEPEYVKAQSYQALWAVREGLARMDGARRWKETDSRKDHTCIRGCEIHNGEVYFKHLIGAGWGDDWKFCVRCVAMILYFNHVDELPCEFYDEWDVVEQKPIRKKQRPMFGTPG